MDRNFARFFYSKSKQLQAISSASVKLYAFFKQLKLKKIYISQKKGSIFS